MSIEHYLPSKKVLDNCSLFKAVAIDTWERIEFSRKTPGLRIMETTITQNIVYELRLLKDRFMHTGYSLFESRNEKANGHDILLRIIHNNHKVYTYALQAKIIYHNLGDHKKGTHLDDGTYPQLKHMVAKGKVNEKAQVDVLLEYARDEGYIPMYLLYNYIKRKYRGIDRNSGCTVIGAQFIKDKYFNNTTKDLSDKVKFSNLHPHLAFPLSKLICTMAGEDDKTILEAVGLPPDYSLTLGDPYYLRTDKEWFDIEDSGKIMELILPEPKLNIASSINNVIDVSSEGFNPKFMILVDQQGNSFG
ncbi:DUF6615 family protein [Pedobacter sp. WC2423]|uniref:DUF6615 family protein n=1 Tax=Pedobacter sp. WC2423 TaxID=3234142 RepID=UPI003467BD38